MVAPDIVLPVPGPAITLVPAIYFLVDGIPPSVVGLSSNVIGYVLLTSAKNIPIPVSTEASSTTNV